MRRRAARSVRDRRVRLLPRPVQGCRVADGHDAEAPGHFSTHDRGRQGRSRPPTSRSAAASGFKADTRRCDPDLRQPHARHRAPDRLHRTDRDACSASRSARPCTQLLRVDRLPRQGRQHQRVTASGGLSGGLGFHLQQGTSGATTPRTRWHQEVSILDSLQGISVGVNGMKRRSTTSRITVGIGAWGFTVGPYFCRPCRCRLARGSAAGAQITVCNCAPGHGVLASTGSASRSPKPVADLVNFFLEKFGSKPIQKSGRHRQPPRSASPRSRTTRTPSSAPASSSTRQRRRPSNAIAQHRVRQVPVRRAHPLDERVHQPEQQPGRDVRVDVRTQSPSASASRTRPAT